MIDPNKSLIIFSHPRSGSHWVQECICTAKQHTFFNLREFFNLVATYEIDYTLKVARGNLRTSNVTSYLDERNQRIQLYKQIQSTYGTVCAKIHVENAIIPEILNFLLKEKSNTQYILLERKNKMDVFWSHLIAYTTNQWHIKTNSPNIEVEPQSIEVKKDAVEKVISSLLTFDKNSSILQNNFDITHVYYEDLLTQQNSEWWNTNSEFNLQNSKDRVVITNYSQVLEWKKIIYENAYCSDS